MENAAAKIELVMNSENMDKKQMYVMTCGTGAKKMSDMVGQRIEIEKYIAYRHLDQQGEWKPALTILTKDGDMVGTNSNSFIEGFLDAMQMLGSELFTSFTVGQNRSKSGHNYLVCNVDL